MRGVGTYVTLDGVAAADTVASPPACSPSSPPSALSRSDVWWVDDHQLGVADDHIDVDEPRSPRRRAADRSQDDGRAGPQLFRRGHRGRPRPGHVRAEGGECGPAGPADRRFGLLRVAQARGEGSTQALVDEADGARSTESQTSLPLSVTTFNTIEAVALLTLCPSERSLLPAADRTKILQLGASLAAATRLSWVSEHRDTPVSGVPSSPRRTPVLAIRYGCDRGIRSVRDPVTQK